MACGALRACITSFYADSNGHKAWFCTIPVQPGLEVRIFSGETDEKITPQDFLQDTISSFFTIVYKYDFLSCCKRTFQCWLWSVPFYRYRNCTSPNYRIVWTSLWPPKCWCFRFVTHSMQLTASVKFVLAFDWIITALTCPPAFQVYKNDIKITAFEQSKNSSHVSIERMCSKLVFPANHDFQQPLSSTIKAFHSVNILCQASLMTWWPTDEGKQW